MHPNNEEMFIDGNPYIQFAIISMVLDELCDKHGDMVNKEMENEIVESITNEHWHCDKDLIAPIGELKFVSVDLDDIDWVGK